VNAINRKTGQKQSIDKHANSCALTVDVFQVTPTSAPKNKKAELYMALCTHNLHVFLHNSSKKAIQRVVAHKNVPTFYGL
jgi:hypothetical protein